MSGRLLASPIHKCCEESCQVSQEAETIVRKTLEARVNNAERAQNLVRLQLLEDKGESLGSETR